MIYLASPYNHEQKAVMAARFHNVAYATAKLMQQGHTIYSPIAHNHYLAQNFDLPRDWNFWKQFDLEVLERCDELWVLKLPGWDKSLGVSEETAFANYLSLPVQYIEWGNVRGENYKYSAA